jgi:signal peptidase II
MRQSLFQRVIPVVYMVSLGGVLLLLDQWSKRAVVKHAADRCIALGPLLNIRCVTHRKSIYKHGSGRALLVLAWFSALVCAVILHHSGAWFQSRNAVFGLGFAFVGAAGNLVDIVRLCSVVDFIDLRWWPVFNLADVAIVAGLAAAFLS